MSDYLEKFGLRVAPELAEFIENSALEGVGVEADALWRGLAGILDEFAPRNKALLKFRDALQSKIDDWHQAHPGPVEDISSYRRFLESIGYLEAEPAPFSIDVSNVDDEIAAMAGPQLVVPVLNDRFVLNAIQANRGRCTGGRFHLGQQDLRRCGGRGFRCRDRDE